MAKRFFRLPRMRSVAIKFPLTPRFYFVLILRTVILSPGIIAKGLTRDWICPF